MNDAPLIYNHTTNFCTYRNLSIKVYLKIRELQNIYNLKAFHKKIENVRLKNQDQYSKSEGEVQRCKHLDKRYDCTID